MDIASLSLKRPVSLVMMFVTMVVIGGIAAVRLPLEFFPEVEAPFVFVNIPYPGSTPVEVERTITRPVEEALATISGIERMDSNSRPDGSQIFMQFKFGRSVAIKASEVRSRIDAIRADLPNDLQRYQVLKFATGDQAVLRVRLSSEQDMSNSYDLLDRKLKRRLERVSGVARADISGVAPPEVEIALLADRVSAHGVGLNELADRLRAANFSTSAGVISDANHRFRVQPIGEFKSLEQIRALPLNEQGLRLGDIADVTLKPGDLDIRRHLDLRPTVGVDVFKERNANLVDVARAALEEVNRISTEPEMQGIRLYILDDQGAGVSTSLKELAEAGLLGALLSLAVLYFFLRHWPSTLMVSLAVPLCFVMTLGLMYFLGLSLNVLSMMGLLLGIGMVVDNAVVAVESIYQMRAKYPDDPPRASVAGVRNVAIALTAGTLCHCIVFLPNIFGAKNFISIYLSHVAFAITISLLASWLVAVTLVPMLSARIAAPAFIHQKSMISGWMDRYEAFVRWTLAHRTKTLVGTFLLLLVSFLPASQVKFDMFPSGETRRLNLNYDINGQYRLEELERNVFVIERWLLEHKDQFEIRSVYSYMSEDFGMGTDILLHEDEKAKRPSSEIMEEIRKSMPKLAIGTVGFGFQRRGGQNGMQISVIGDSGEVLRELGTTILPLLSRVKGVRDVRMDESSANREIAVRVDRERAAYYGFSAQEVATYIAVALRGAPLREYRNEDKEVPVWLRFQDSDKASVDDLSDYKLRRADGTQVPLMAMVAVSTADTPSAIGRANRQTAIQLKINIDDKSSTTDEARKAIEASMNAVKLPPGYRWSFGGGFDDSDEAGKQMLFNIFIALLMIYIVMAAVFESLLFPAAILTTIVYSIFGVFWLFWLTGTTFSIMAMIGILVLMGVVVNNGIVMVEHINQLRVAGQSRTDALAHGCRDRLRPILMTMGTAILGMLPICISSTQIGGNGPPYYPMARAIVGGLIFSTIVTLAVMPTIYALLDDWRTKAGRLLRDARAPRRKADTARVLATDP